MRVYSVTCIVGTGEGEVRGKTVAEIIDSLCLSKGKEFKDAVYRKGTRKIYDIYIITVNGERVDIEKGLGRKVKKGDMVSILPDLGPCC